MIVTGELSRKLHFFTFLLTLMVVLLHTYKYEVYTASSADFKIIYYIETFLSVGICRTAVPLFFCISGFLFFKEVERFSLADFVSKLKKRTYTLLFPFLIVSAFSIFVYSFLFDISGISQNVFGLAPMDYSMKNILNTWLLNPRAYQLWFLQYLMVMVLVSPLIYWLLTKLKAVYVLAILLVWMLFSYQLPHIFLSLVFFSIGGYFSLNVKQFPRCETLLAPMLLIALWFVLICFTELGLFDLSISVKSVLINLYTIAGIAGMWLLYDFVSSNRLDNVLGFSLSGFVFFIYLFHEPFLSYLIALLFKLMGTNTLSGFAIYIISPSLSVVLFWATGYLLKKYLPNIYSFISGSR